MITSTTLSPFIRVSIFPPHNNNLLKTYFSASGQFVQKQALYHFPIGPLDQSTFIILTQEHSLPIHPFLFYTICPKVDFYHFFHWSIGPITSLFHNIFIDIRVLAFLSYGIIREKEVGQNEGQIKTYY